MNALAKSNASIKEKMPEGIRTRMAELCRVHGPRCQFHERECKRGMRVVHLAVLIKESSSTLYNCLGGRNEPSYRLAVKLAWALGWTQEELTLKFFSEPPLAGIAEKGKIDPTAKQNSELSQIDSQDLVA